MPLDEEYRWLRGLCAASTSFSTATSGEGMSGLPKPRSMTSSPARRAASFNASISAKTYGGRPLIRRNSIDSGYRRKNAPSLRAWSGRRVCRCDLGDLSKPCEITLPADNDPARTRTSEIGELGGSERSAPRQLSSPGDVRLLRQRRDARYRGCPEVE